MFKQSRRNRTSFVKTMFTTMTMVLILGGSLSPVIPLLQASVDAAAQSDALEPNPPINIDNPIIPDPIQVDPIQIDPPIIGDPPVDSDQDGIPDQQDSCPNIPNIGRDWNDNGIDDACDPPPPPDRDGDGYPDQQDSCPDNPNTGADWDSDGIDDACDPPPPPPDRDGDSIPDDQDTCPDNPNTGSDWNGNGSDDACDPPPPPDRDGDGIPDGEDSCPDVGNLGLDWNGDGMDDACDPPPDNDNDGIPNFDDSCPDHPNTGGDWDGDGMDDACDPQPIDESPIEAPIVVAVANDAKYLIVETHWCPAGTDIFNIPENDPGPASQCNLPGFEVTVVLESKTDSANNTQQTVTPPDFMAEFNPIQADTWNLHVETTPPVALENLVCARFHDQGNTKPYGSASFAITSASPWSYYDVETVVDEYTYCFWYAIPETEYAKTGDLLIEKFECTTSPESGAAFQWFADNCTTPMEGVEFTGTGPGSTTFTHTTESNGRITRVGLIPGTYEVTETLPEGYMPQALFCREANRGVGVVETPTEVTISGTSAELEVPVNHWLHCYWYNVSTAGDNGSTITIHKFECPAGTTSDANMGWLSANCITPMEGVEFTVTQDGDSHVLSTDAAGTATRPLGGGPFEVSETVPEGFSPNPIAVCVRNSVDEETGRPILGKYTKVELTGSTWSTENKANNVDIECFWYNIPLADQNDDDPGDLKLMKYECPSAAPAASTYEWYRDNCLTTMDGVKFTLDVPDPEADISTSTNDTGTSGYIQMLGQNPGTYPLIEEVPAGYTPLALFCADVLTDASPADSDFAPMTLVGNGANITITSDRLLYCHWYNVPADNGNDDGTITIFKLECPAGTASDADMVWLADNCLTPMEGVEFSLTHGIDSFLLTTDATGKTSHAIGAGNIVVSELVPEGYSPNPMAVCGFESPDGSGLPVAGGPTKVEITSAMWTYDVPDDTPNIVCFWFNIPIPDSTVTIHKWECPEGTPAEMTATWFQANCTTPMDGVPFDVTDSKGPRQKLTSAGAAQWTDVASGKVQITEHVPVGYHPNPFVVCTTFYPDGTDSGSFTPVTVNGVWNTSILTPGSEISCDWYNWYLGSGDITVHKFTCPDGYDHTAWGADPMTECTEATDGITFRLDQPDPAADIDAVTDSSGAGTVFFGDLAPGNYTLTEILDPAVSMQDIFVWQCVGLETSSVHPTPLSVGVDLNFTITAGDEIVCHWFNVPYPEYGWMEVHKFNCTTEKYVSDVYCYTNQTGQEFNLQIWDGSNWVTIQSGVTDVSGKLNFTNLDTGDYRLIEPDSEACLIKSSNITANGNLGVTAGEGTTVYVFNCKVPPPPQKTPTKYPNTGVGNAAEGDITWTPGIALTGLAGLLGTQFTRRRLVAGAGLAAASSLPLAMAQQIVPLEEEMATPSAGTPEPSLFWCPSPTASTPEVNATPMVDPCNRGAIPTHMRIPVIDVDAPMEYLEIIDGQMEQPTGDTHITWYKETSRLGEIGNGIYAAHLNWWGNPEGIFFRLESLKEGDVIEIDGDDQQTLLYEVQWTQNFPSDEEPPEEALGITNEPVITLITCGGEWSSALSEYDHRTLVRAVLRE